MKHKFLKRFCISILAVALFSTPLTVLAEELPDATTPATEPVSEEAPAPVRTVEQNPKTKKWVCMLNGKLDKQFTGLAKRPDNKKWYFFQKGKLAETLTGIVKDENAKKWVRVKKGRLDTSFTGLAKRPDNKKWYFFKKGRLNTEYTGVAKNRSNKKWYRVEKGRINKKYNGVAERPETGTWYYIKNGLFDKSYTGIAQNKESKAWYRIEDGLANLSYTGVALRPENKKRYYFKDGSMDKAYAGLAEDPANGDIYMIKKGKVDKKHSDVTRYTKDNQLYYMKKGKWVRDLCGFIKGDDGRTYYYNHGVQKYSTLVKKGKTYFYEVDSKTPIKSQRQLLLMMMRSWIGLNMADGSHQAIIDTYNRVYPLPVNYRVTYTDDWCDTCVSAAGIATGLSGYFGRECGVQRHIGIFQSMGIWQEDGRVRPKPGDLICFTWGATSQPNDGFANHIAVVEKVSKKGVITILEGNNKDSAVGRRKFKVGDPVIRGYAIPRYAS